MTPPPFVPGRDRERRFRGDGRLTPGADRRKHVVITGGAGFVGCNLAHRLLSAGQRVLIYDSLARPGVERNLAWLRATHGDRVRAAIDDVRNPAPLRAAVHGASMVFHFAAQVAVTTSLVEPTDDFDVNARGTLNVLEAVRASDAQPAVLFTSTNKVYGDLADVPLTADTRRYALGDAIDVAGVSRLGVSEARPLDFHSPYGCSKGAADQYVLDWARSYGIAATVFRMSCIYGPHQFGTEDQGWIAHFLLRAAASEPIILFGDGRQVRDALYVDDLVDAFTAAMAQREAVQGRAFNIGGGAQHTTSLLELLDRIAELQQHRCVVEHQPWRTGDQKWYVSDTSRFTEATGWRPKTTVTDGVERLHSWLHASRQGELDYALLEQARAI